ncbi:MAG TPA: metallopeptidase TldD-related protein [Anaeromyxobacteraceae bacterium]|nr:metallopeptidase TldD-related protein [Anaeromyxobacteraceae bacterium]
MAPALLALALLAADPRLAVLDAMAQELDRSASRLKLDGFEAPYYVGYQVRDVTALEVSGRYGAVMDDLSRHDRTLFVDVRVGSHELDSSGGGDDVMILGGELPSWSAPKDAPIDDDPQALRNALWLLTDERYKEALASYFKKRSREVYRASDPQRAPSFSREAPERQLEPPRPFPFDRERWRRAVRDTTAAFRGQPAVFDAQVKVTAERQVRWLATSEGTRLVTERTLYAVHLQAVARAEDGQLLEGGRDFYALDEAGLPTPARLAEAAQAVAAELTALRSAPAIDPYTGPAILEPEATGVLFHEAVGHRLEGERIDDDKEGQTYAGQIGKQVLPAFLTIVDDPTRAEAAGTPLNGTYAFDDQGVRARRTVLVQDGKLVSYLLSRKPVKPFEHSNGHGRSQGTRPPMARMANLVVESSRAVGREELKRMLMAEARRQGKPYGLVIRDITGGNTNTMSFGYQAFKGTPRLVYRVDAETGAETLVRGVEMVGTPLTSVNKVLATGDAVRVFNGYCGAESGYVPVSTVAPAALVGEIELQRVARATERGPILPSPWQTVPAATPTPTPTSTRSR